MYKIESFTQLKEFIRCDLYRYIGKTVGNGDLLKGYFRIPGFRYSFWLRCANYYSGRNKIAGLYCRLRLRHYSIKYGIQIPYPTNINKGLYIGHFGDIVVNLNATLGKNVNISQGVTIGQANRGAFKGAAILGDEVYIAPGAKIVGKITIGNNVAIGANAVITRDVPDDAVVVGIPGKIISYDGATGYIEKKV
ncbi:serine acetyltransferase [Niabella sp.]|uniref:serine O-acetyltransferase n=1 Tax=Niabella sp. TaxID=1962976 RepID=UPI00260AB6C5|nr:serine acetyltransferase [Niabella sp.]